MAEWRLIYWYVDHLLTHRLHALRLLERSKAAVAASSNAGPGPSAQGSSSASDSRQHGATTFFRFSVVRRYYMISCSHCVRLESAKKGKGKRGKWKDDKGSRPQSARTRAALESGGSDWQACLLRVEQLRLEAQRALCAASFRVRSACPSTFSTCGVLHACMQTDRERLRASY